MTTGTLSPTEKDLYKIVALVRELAERNNSGVATTDLNNDAVTNAKLANMAQSTVKGRAAGAGTGDPTDLGVAQLIAILGIPANIRKFTSSGTYPTVANGDVKVLVMAKGGGGGGGGSSIAGGAAGGGGGEGAESWKLTTASALSGQTVTIGGGGANVAQNTNANGGTGGTTSIGAVITAPGGGGGITGNSGGAGGTGGSGGTNDWGMPGAAGQPGTDFIASIGISASGAGKGGGTGFVAGAGNSGGGGGCGNSTIAASGAGGSGLIVCIEFGAI